MALFPDAWWGMWWPIAIVFVLAGVTGAVSQAASNLALARSVPSDRYGLLFGLRHSAVPAAAMLGGLAVLVIDQSKIFEQFNLNLLTFSINQLYLSLFHMKIWIFEIHLK